MFTVIFSFILVFLEEEESNGSKASSNMSIFGLSLRNLSQHKVLLPFIVSFSMFMLTSIYVIFVRGFSSRWLIGGVYHNYDDVFQANFGKASRITHHSNIAKLAKLHSSHQEMVTMTSKLAASGFWTSRSFIGPTIHLLGVIFLIPTWHSIALLAATPTLEHSKVLQSLPLNLVSLFLCRGIPSLTAAAIVGSSITIYQYYMLKYHTWRLKMKSC